MLKNISLLALTGALTFAVSTTGCVVVTDDGNEEAGDGDGTTGDGDGDSDGTTGDGDGDGDATGDGDGDATGDGDGDATGDGDGDATGDGDGDATGDGDGDTTAACGWDGDSAYYACGFEGEDPSGTFPMACPEGLVEGDPCGELTGTGCCDAEGNNWYCASIDGEELVVMDSCSE